MRPLNCLLYILSLSIFTGIAYASDTEEGVKREIIERCTSEMEAYGSAMVKACVDQDVEAFNALAGYPDAAGDILDRCRREMEAHGWAIVKACADQDIEAAAALAKYPESANDIVARCRREMEEFGWAIVKACADQDIEAERALRDD